MPFITNIVFYFPFLYFFKTRVKSLTKKIGWLFSYVVPILLTTIIIDGELVVSVIFMIISIYSIYEFGYIYNDAITIKKENKPTLRIDSDEIIFIRRNLKKILFFRLFVSVIIMLCINPILTIIPVLILIVFYIYNNIRSRINLLLHFILVCLRYSSPFIIFHNLEVIVFSIFIFPVINLFERMTEIRFNYISLIKYRENISLIRCGYYLILSVVSFLLIGVNVSLFISLYYLLFRIIIFGCKK